jgi:hypothetical protein
MKNRPLAASVEFSWRHAALISMAPSPASPATAASPHGSETIGMLGLAPHVPPYCARLFIVFCVAVFSGE